MLPKWSQISALWIHLAHYSQSDDHLKMHPNTHLFKDWSWLPATCGAAWHSKVHSPAAICLCSLIYSALPSPALQLWTLCSSPSKHSVLVQTSAPSHHVVLCAQNYFFWAFQKGHWDLEAGYTNIPVTSSDVEITAWSHRGHEMEIYSCCSWNSR